tara:strand:- start:1031 stop:1183 length:153 start_codon:yes stop_codon:yes gene_type:complete
MEFLIAAVISCEGAEKLISRIQTSQENGSELVQIIKLNSEEGCYEDAKAD